MPVRVSENLEFEEPIDQFDKDWILASLSELIVTVRNSFMPDDLKNATIQELQDLVDFVEGSVLMSEMKAKAIGTVAAIDSLVDNANTAVNIGEKLALSTNPSVADLGEQMKLLSAPEAQRAFSELGDALRTYDAETRKAIAGEIDSLIDESGVSASDPLHQLMRKITTAMNTGSAGATSSAFEQALPEVFEKVQLQSLNAYTGGYVITEICNLFGITADDLANENIEIVIPEQGTPDLDPDVGGGNDDDDDDDKPLGPGGLGTGEIIYGSNDMIFDPNKNEYVSYGELLNEYYAKVSEMINDGKTSDEVAELADYYYGLLFGSHNSSGN